MTKSEITKLASKNAKAIFADSELQSILSEHKEVSSFDAYWGGSASSSVYSDYATGNVKEVSA